MRKLLTLSLAAIVAAPVLAVSAALPETAAVSKTATYIRTTQQADGGFGGFGDGQSYDAVLALRAAGIDVKAVTKDGKSPVDFINAKAAEADTPAEGAKAALAALAAGLNPANVNGKNLISEISEGYTASNGQYAADDFSQSLSILGLACTDNDVPALAITALREAQQGNGAWGFSGTPDPDTTALAIQALIAAGVSASDTDVTAAFDYLISTQGDDGGWGFDPTESNPNSTAFIVQAMLAAGLDPEAAAYEKNGVNPVEFILTKQLEDGSFSGFDPAYAANQVLPALAGRTFCDTATTPLQVSPSPTATTTASPSVTTTTTPVTATATATSVPATATSTATTVPPTATSTATTATATRTNTVAATATRTSTRATGTATRTPVAPRTGSGGDDGGSSVPFVALAAAALALGGAGFAVSARRK